MDETTVRALRAPHMSGPTVLLEAGNLRLLTDPKFDGVGTRYADGPVELTKLAGPAVSTGEI